MPRRRARDAHVLVLTHSGDVDVPERVMDAVRARGATCARIDTDQLPSDAALTLDVADARVRAVWTTRHHEEDLTRATSIWCRRLWPAARAGATPLDAWSAQQARDALFGVLATLTHARRGARAGVRVVNDPHAQARAEHKALQLAAATRAGLRVPATVITNDPTSARAFLAARDRATGRVVTKLLVPLSQSTRGDGPWVPTSLVDDDDARALDALQAAPQIFQAAIDKRQDARVVLVGARAFAGALDARPGDPLDWTRGPRRTWRKVTVPPTVLRPARKLLAALGLAFGVLDFVVDARGAWHFLEVNPAGEWGFLADDLPAPIADALAELLAP